MTSTTPEPELNVEAIVEAVLHKLYSKGYGDAASKYVPADPNAWMDQKQATEAILALIQQVSGQRVREALEAIPITLEGQLCFDDALKVAKGIDQTLTEHLNHKEARSG